MSTSAPPSLPLVDVQVPRFNQAVVAILTATAFIAQWPWLVGLAFLMLAVSRVFGPSVAPLTQLYVRVIRPRFTSEGELELEDARPPAFSQALGATVLGMAGLALATGLSGLGWTLTLMVTALAALAAVARVCVGCLLYERFIGADR